MSDSVPSFSDGAGLTRDDREDTGDERADDHAGHTLLGGETWWASDPYLTRFWPVWHIPYASKDEPVVYALIQAPETNQ